MRFGGATAAASSDPLLLDAADQLRAYFAGELREFDLPLAPRGTEFQRQVWAAVSGDPLRRHRGLLGDRRRDRTPQRLPRRRRRERPQPAPVIVPCHRVIGAAGSLTGYGGGLDRKRSLLDLERAAG